ncbi:MAG: tryptophan synthase subunit alpha [Candidatus Methanofastidiosia archaeon]
MNRIDETFKTLKKKNQRAFIPYITCGDPSLMETLKIINILEENGADILELGIPHSDPVADGKTIQTSVERALRCGTTPKKVLEILEIAREKCRIPMILLTYYNIVLQYGIKKFISDFSNVSDGLIVADLPPEESFELVKYSIKYNFSNIFLASPITPRKRLQSILKVTTGFLYMVSLLGVTGEREKLSQNIFDFMKKMRTYTKIPMCVGFGISKPEHVLEVSKFGADGVIVGSGIVRRLGNLEEVKEYVGRMSAPTKNRKLYKSLHCTGVDEC